MSDALTAIAVAILVIAATALMLRPGPSSRMVEMRDRERMRAALDPNVGTRRTRGGGDGDDASLPVPRLATMRMVMEEHLADRFVTGETGDRVRVTIPAGVETWAELARVRGRFYAAATRAGVTVKTKTWPSPISLDAYELEVTLFR